MSPSSFPLTLRRAFLLFLILLVAGLAILWLRVHPTPPPPTLLTVYPTDSLLTAVESYDYGNANHSHQQRHGYRYDNRPSDDAQPWPKTPMQKRSEHTPLMVELNEADTITLQLLYGVGPTYARRIVRYRDRLGGFVATDQLLEVYGFDSTRYAGLVDHISVDTARVIPIKINSVSVKELARHPYVDYYLARDIVRWREQGHQFHAADDLRMVSSLDEATLQCLLPYLSFVD